MGMVFIMKNWQGQLRKFDPNESVSLDPFTFVRWHVDEEVSMESID